MNKIEYISKPENVSMSEIWYSIADLNHFWIKWRFSVFRKYFKSLIPNDPILEIGCGNGIIVKQFENIGYEIDGCDLNDNALNMIGKTKGNIYCYNIFDLNQNLLNKYGSIVLMDVIEHIENDELFLINACKHLKKGGFVLINVPAFNSLFSKYDTEAGHYRRYTRNKIKILFSNVGIEPIELTYWGFTIVPVALIRKFLLNYIKKENIIEKGFKPPGKYSHQMLNLLMKLELSLPIRFPLGTSLMALGKIKS